MLQAVISILRLNVFYVNARCSVSRDLICAPKVQVRVFCLMFGLFALVAVSRVFLYARIK